MQDGSFLPKDRLHKIQDTLQTFLETDADPSLISKWRWNESP
jgi:hypothetical protein